MPTIDWSQISNMVLKTNYDTLTLDLTVHFKTGRYMYKGVPNEVYDRLKVTDSIGKFINAEIKPKYQFIKLS